MKLGKRISLLYIGSVITITTVIMSIFYGFASNYIDKLFYSYLLEKAHLTAEKHWEKDELDDKIYALIQKRYSELLPTAQEYIFNTDTLNRLSPALKSFLSDQEINLILSKEPVLFKKDNKFGVGIYYPDNEGNFIVITLSENSYGNELKNNLLALLIILLLLGAAVVYIAGITYSTKILAPMQQLVSDIKHVSGNNLNIRIKQSQNKDEIDELIYSVNSMLDRIDEALSSEKSFITNASHELNNPITAIIGECEITLLKERSKEEYISSLQRINYESKRISQLTHNLLLLSRQNNAIRNCNADLISLKDLILEITSENQRTNIRIEDSKNDYLIQADRQLLHTAIGNIIDNACKYSRNKKVDIQLISKPKVYILTITDYGIGIPKNELANIFQSFYRAENAREYNGHGIGLNLSLRVIKSINADIIINSEENEYTTVTIYIPKVD